MYEDTPYLRDAGWFNGVEKNSISYSAEHGYAKQFD